MKDDAMSIVVSPIPNLTPRAEQVLALARKEAGRLNHNFVSTSHLLLGLIKLAQGTAFYCLQKLGVNLEDTRIAVEKRTLPGLEDTPTVDAPYTPRSKKVLKYAMEEATALAHTYVGTEHILLGLIREGEGGAAEVLKGQHVDLESLRTEIMHQFDPTLKRLPTDHTVRQYRTDYEQLLNKQVLLTGCGGGKHVKVSELESLSVVLLGRAIHITPKIAACIIACTEDNDVLNPDALALLLFAVHTEKKT